MWQAPYRKNDVESGSTPLYPMMLEAPELRWAFIRKVYSIVALQLLLTIAVGSVVVTYRPIATFFVSTGAGLALYIVLIITPFIGALILIQFVFIRPFVSVILISSLLHLLLVCFNVETSLCSAVSFVLLPPASPGELSATWDFHCGACLCYWLDMRVYQWQFERGQCQTCPKNMLNITGKVILESVILTTVVVVSLTLYTFWAARRGHDFNFLGPFLFGALMVLLVFGLIQMLFPMGKVSVMIYGGLASIIFCGYILYDTDNLIKRYSYDEYIWAAVVLYLDIINLFLSLLTIFRAAES
ncbi:hypothetical protein RJ639_010125 [Escallonia herrerae]|uniref:BI1-like protein n=1 Tax=Escallonia herrerae TaxID=1293975 RepID=A0AA88VR45_9ASTE|nr:hypothetical protein RJ639_010125 [Escallonia herrerae]